MVDMPPYTVKHMNEFSPHVMQQLGVGTDRFKMACYSNARMLTPPQGTVACNRDPMTVHPDVAITDTFGALLGGLASSDARLRVAQLITTLPETANIDGGGSEGAGSSNTYTPCDCCGKAGAPFQCPKCGTGYCDEACQHKGWKRHKKVCAARAKERVGGETAVLRVGHMSVKELKKSIVDAGMSHADCVEKAELRARAEVALLKKKARPLLYVADGFTALGRLQFTVKQGGLIDTKQIPRPLGLETLKQASVLPEAVLQLERFTEAALQGADVPGVWKGRYHQDRYEEEEQRRLECLKADMLAPPGTTKLTNAQKEALFTTNPVTQQRLNSFLMMASITHSASKPESAEKLIQSLTQSSTAAMDGNMPGTISGDPRMKEALERGAREMVENLGGNTPASRPVKGSQGVGACNTCFKRAGASVKLFKCSKCKNAFYVSFSFPSAPRFMVFALSRVHVLLSSHFRHEGTTSRTYTHQLTFSHRFTRYLHAPVLAGLSACRLAQA